MIRLCIFDCDGTLLDTLESIAHSANLAMKDLGYPEVETGLYRKMVGDGAAMLVRRLLSYAGESDPAAFEKLSDRYMEYFKEGCVYHVKPYEGICELLDTLKAEGIRTAVLSNKPDAQTGKVIEDSFGKERFDVILGQKEGIPRKPAPDGALKILKMLDVQPEECLYIGDTDTDMQTGNTAGLHTVGVLWGFRDRKELEDNHAEYIAEKPSDLLSFLS